MLKYLLGRKVRFHDLAFFDPVIYESLRQLVLDAEKKETSAQLFAALELTFSIDLSPEEAGGSGAGAGGVANVELVSHGRDLEVNSHNIYAYVRKYSTYRYHTHILLCHLRCFFSEKVHHYLLNKMMFTFQMFL